MRANQPGDVTRPGAANQQFQLEVVFVQTCIPPYRVPFFEQLRDRLARFGVRTRVIVSDLPSGTEERRDRSLLSWVEHIPARRFSFGKRTLEWQPLFGSVRNSDLVVVQQASHLLTNYALLARARLGGPSVVFWGHGANVTGLAPSRAGEQVKRWVSRLPDWWFAYTEGSAKIVASLGFDEERITVMNNSTDVAALANARSRLSTEEVEENRAELGLQGHLVAAFVGGLKEEKRIAFLLEAALIVRERLPGFELIVIGDGPDGEIVRAAASRWDWIHWIGEASGVDLALPVSHAGLLLMPGRVGLVSVDSFALGIPIVTTAWPYHAPEFEYLAHGDNAWVVDDWADPVAFAAAVVRLMSDDVRRRALVAGCRRSSEEFTIEKMVERASTGVLQALRYSS